MANFPNGLRVTHVADYFARWRERYRLNLNEAAERLNISTDDVQTIEAGDRVSPSVAARVNYRLAYRAARSVKGKADSDYDAA